MTTSQPLITAAPTLHDGEGRRRDFPPNICGFVEDSGDSFACNSLNRCAALRTEYGSPLWAASCNEQKSGTTYYPTACTTTCTDTACVIDFSLRKCTSSPYTTCVLETWPAINVQYWECWRRGTDPFLGHTPTYTMNLSSADVTASPWLIYVATEVLGSISSDILTTVSAPFTGISLMVAGSSTSKPTISTSNPTATTTPTPSPSSTSSANIGVIAGGAIGGVITISILIYLFWRARSKRKGQQTVASGYKMAPMGSSATLTRPTSYAPTTSSRAAYSEVDPYESPAHSYQDSPWQPDATFEVQEGRNHIRPLEASLEASDTRSTDSASIMSRKFSAATRKNPMPGFYNVSSPVNEESN